MAHKKTMEIFLQPGEYFVGGAEYRVRTLLGSCVSITLWHPFKRIGAMSHFLLAERGVKQVVELDGRYGADAMALMMRDMANEGVKLTECQAKIFGGGNMFPNQVRGNALLIGQKNGEAARQLLRIYAIPVVSESLYGVGYRQIIFDISNGHVWSRHVKSAEGEFVNFEE